MTKIDELKKELEIREAYHKGEKIEYKEDSDYWRVGASLCFCLSPVHECYRIHDPYREFKEAQKAGKIVQFLDGTKWKSSPNYGSHKWLYSHPPENYRIKPEEAKKEQEKIVKPENPSAFPGEINNDWETAQGMKKQYKGMTLLEYYAGEAINLFEVDEDNVNQIQKGGIPNHSLVAKFCYDLAEAMLREREKRIKE